MKAVFITTSTDNCNPIVGGWAAHANVPPAVIRFNEASPTPDDEGMVDQLKEYAPDVVFYIGSARLPGNPRPSVLAEIRHLFPHIHICFDGADSPWWEILLQYKQARCFDLQVNIDGGSCPTADLVTLPPMDPRPYVLPDVQKIRRAGFAGFTANTYRGTVINPLIQKRLVELRHRKAGYRNSDYQEFAQWLCETRITVNTALTGTNLRRHVKGRIIEVGLAAVCVLEDGASPTKIWFKPGEEFLPWSHPTEIEYMLRNISDAEAERIGRNLQSAIREKYSARIIYGAMLAKAQEARR